MDVFVFNQEEGLVRKVADPVFWMTNPKGQEIYLGLITIPINPEISKSIEEKRGKADSVVLVACDKEGNLLKGGNLINFSPLGVGILCSNVSEDVCDTRGEYEEMAVLPAPLAMVALVAAFFEAIGKGLQ